MFSHSHLLLYKLPVCELLWQIKNGTELSVPKENAWGFAVFVVTERGFSFGSLQ